jgi:hypothetical protein
VEIQRVRMGCTSDPVRVSKIQLTRMRHPGTKSLSLATAYRGSTAQRNDNDQCTPSNTRSIDLGVEAADAPWPVPGAGVGFDVVVHVLVDAGSPASVHRPSRLSIRSNSICRTEKQGPQKRARTGP